MVFKFVIITGLAYIAYKISKMANELETLQTEVQENQTVIGSAITLLQGLKAQLDAAGTDATKLAELSAQLDSQSNALAAAVAANTPANEEEPTEPGEENPQG